MSLHEFMQAFEQAKIAFPAERSKLPFRTRFTEGHTFYGTLVGLRHDWKDPDPGKFQPHWFFVRDYATRPSPFHGGTEVAWCDRFWVKDVIDDAKAAEAGNPFWCGYPQNVSRPVPLGTFADVKRETCPCCGTDGFVVGCYEQSRNSIEFDQWDVTVSVLCLDCRAVTRRHWRSECRRSLELLERPKA
jgi:hypothetical protein